MIRAFKFGILIGLAIYVVRMLVAFNALAHLAGGLSTANVVGNAGFFLPWFAISTVVATLGVYFVLANKRA